MQLSKFTDYSLRMLMYCGLRPDEPSTVAAVAKAFAVSQHHLVKVAAKLCELGYLSATRGAGGGLTMATPAERIVLGELVRATENLTLVECMGEAADCPLTGACQLQRTLLRARAAFLVVLDDCTLADLLRPRAPLSRRLLG